MCQEVDIEEVLAATLPNEPVCGDEELEVLSNPLLASSPGKEVKKKEVPSSDLEVDLFAPPPYGHRATHEVRGKESLAKCPPPPLKVKGGKALRSAPPVDPPTSKRRTRSTIPSKTTPLGVGHWLTDKEPVWWLNQEVSHMEISEPRVWTVALLYIKRLLRYMQRVEPGTRVANMTWCRRHIFVGNSNDKGGLHCFVCAFDVVSGWSFSVFGFGNP